MPTYEYKCQQCSYKASVIAAINAIKHIPFCVACQREMVRDFGIAAVSFKGPGFYRTDK
jgi:putative FmdB family regulatory protein